MTSGCASGGCGGVMAVQADRARMAAAVARVGARLDAVTRLGGVRYGVGVAYDSGESLEWRLGEPSRLAVDRARVARRRPTGRGSGTGRRMAVEPGSDPSAYHEADAVNDSIGGVFQSLPRWLQDWVRYGSAGRGRLVPPPAENWGSSCVSEEAVARCGDVSDQHARGLGCRNTDSRDWVEVTRCTDAMEGLIRDAWCLINDNLDVIEWILCMVFPHGDIAAFRERVQRRGLMRVRVKCVDECDESTAAWIPGGDGHEVWGGKIRLCPDKTYKAVSECGATDDALRGCVIINLASTLLHELAHLVFDIPEDDTDDCSLGNRVLAVENSFRWAMLRRYSEAMACSCCTEQFSDGAGGVRDSVFMNNTTLGVGACECADGGKGG